MNLPKKKILFFAHSNNDIDHYLPIIHENKKYEILIFFCPDGNTCEINTLHSKLISQYKIKIIRIENLFNFPFFKILYFLFQKLKFFKINIKKKYIFSKILSILILLSDKILMNSISQKRLKKNFENLLNSYNVSLVVLDIQKQNYNDNSSFFRKSLSSFLNVSKKLNLPLFMMTHGANIVVHDNKESISFDKKSFQSDRLALCNNFETFLYKNLAKKKEYVKNLGDVRFDISWINYLKKENSKKIKDLNEKNNNLKILYVLGNLSFLNNQIENSINKEITNLLNDFDNIEMWVKTHPRTNINFNFEHKNLKIFYQDVDTSILVQASDIVLTTLSGILTEAILSEKLTILYDSWKKHLKNPWTIFDETNCVKKVKNYSELKKEINFYNKTNKTSFQEREDYFKKFISGGRSINESLSQSYLSEIDNLLKVTN